MQQPSSQQPSPQQSGEVSSRLSEHKAAAPAEATAYVTEVYTSIQGESRYAGLPCTFIRLSGCSLRCRWCDTVYSYQQGKAAAIKELIADLPAYPKLVEITGGEPLEQPAAIPLMQGLIDAGYEVLLETSGSEPIADVPKGVTIICDIKCPGSGMEQRNHWDNIAQLKPADEVKFVIADRTDFEYAKAIMAQYSLTERCKVLMSVAFGQLKEAELVEWVLADKLDVRFNLQQHKYIWSPRKKGV